MSMDISVSDQGVTERLDAVYSAEPDAAEQDALVADLQRRVLGQEDWDEDDL